ncbi:class II fructose-bisphosphate aldolase [Anaerostipes sp.]|uniref:class II fructose-bisphosphate aldolase n=1 Tax=Anaerostipes sp. TaxID=1872530 RepID=UPI0025BF0D5C|nr:class II fructose-bisphosphate aldolase [Anaerostipes sp.]MBS7009192.1 class II fructose-bisphosphate aldolase [Anaerostipes sp.]
MLVNSKEILKTAKEGHYAVPAVNVFNLESIKGVLEAAEETNHPLMVCLAEVHTPQLGIEEAAHIIKYYAGKCKQDIVLHYDHGFTPEMVKQAIDAGFTSVMIDGSSLPFEENVEKTKEITDYAHERNVTVEAEIGHVGGGESYLDPDEDDTMLTEADEAVEFAELTGVDSLAVSIGTAHGEYKGTPHLNFERLEQIADSVEVPLVLHGGSGSGDENLTKAVQLGICKVNIFTDLTIAAREKTKEGYGQRSYYDSTKLAVQGMKECLEHYYEVFQTKGEK